jgi:hypothetical protein
MDANRRRQCLEHVAATGRRDDLDFSAHARKRSMRPA